MITRWEERDRGPGCGVRSVLATSGSGTLHLSEDEMPAAELVLTLVSLPSRWKSSHQVTRP